jgi:hypothetical protein
MRLQYCPFCRTAYDDDLTHCPDCQVRLVAELPKQGHGYQPVEEVPIRRFKSQIEAEMCADILAQAGIPCVLIPLGPGSGGFGTSLWVPHELRVRADDVEKARGLLAAGE